jgi:hypothetical protein
MDLEEIRWSSMEKIVLAEERDQWRTLVNIVVNFQVP